MKTIKFIAFFLLSAASLAGSANTTVKSFVAMDDSVKAMLEFYKADTILVVLPDAYVMKKEYAETIENFVFWKNKPVYVYKHESELQEKDLSKNLQFFGPAYKFSDKTLSGIPFTTDDQGFSYKGRWFRAPQDAFYYMHPTHKKLVTCQNSDEYPLAYLGFLAGAYQLYVWHGNELVYSGNEATAKAAEQINDMDSLRNSYFCRKINSRYFNLYFNCSLPEDSVSPILGAELDDYVNKLCFHLSLDTTGLIATDNYFYAQREELQYFIAAPLWQTIYGKSYGDINHVTGFSLATLKHENGHSIIGAKLGFNPYPFFLEGFRQYTDYFFSQEAYLNDLKIFRENRERLTSGLVFSHGSEFFRGMDNYSISGVFISYMIDRLGLEAFKEAYTNNQFNELLTSKGLSIDKLIADFNAKN